MQVNLTIFVQSSLLEKNMWVVCHNQIPKSMSIMEGKGFGSPRDTSSLPFGFCKLQPNQREMRDPTQLTPHLELERMFGEISSLKDNGWLKVNYAG